VGALQFSPVHVDLAGPWRHGDVAQRDRHVSAI
jgi:hypothetical protein